ncbi:hypothetical protein M0R45_031025 [Rubus argutus]|uniref:Uncharacterized protein n=1 Tax=Rubus argutus TaxID=59490 RepID=A0AAW1VLL1_RUBAR
MCPHGPPSVPSPPSKVCSFSPSLSPSFEPNFLNYSHRNHHNNYHHHHHDHIPKGPSPYIQSIPTISEPSRLGLITERLSMSPSRRAVEEWEEI